VPLAVGSIILILLGIAFWTVDRIAENLVIQTTERKGQDRAQLALLEMHWRWTIQNIIGKAKSNPASAFGLDDTLDYEQRIADLWRTSGGDSAILTVLGESAFPKTKVLLPESDAELQILGRLKVKFRDQIERASRRLRNRRRRREMQLGRWPAPRVSF